jgi:hypothetical protein
MNGATRERMSYQRFLRWRGISNPRNPTLYLTRGVIRCWFEPGFHRFWQKWNPPVGFLAYRLYSAFRRSRSFRLPATVLTFVTIGLAHDIIGILIIGRFTFKAALVFLCFGCLAMVSRSVQSVLRQHHWPAFANAMVNALLVYVSFRAGNAMSVALPL